MMKDLETSLSEETWAVVFTSAGKFIGMMTDIVQRYPDHIDLSSCRLCWAQELFDQALPRQGVVDGQPTLVFERFIQVRTVSNCLDIENTYLIVQPSCILYFDHMSAKDKEWHKNLVRTGIRNAVQQRARASGILTPGDGFQTGHA